MATMTIRMSDQDAEMVRRYAAFEGKTISDFARDAILGVIEDAQDLDELRRAMEQDDGEHLSHEQVVAELGMR